MNFQYIHIKLLARLGPDGFFTSESATTKLEPSKPGTMPPRAARAGSNSSNNPLRLTARNLELNEHAPLLVIPIETEEAPAAEPKAEDATAEEPEHKGEVEDKEESEDKESPADDVPKTPTNSKSPPGWTRSPRSPKSSKFNKKKNRLSWGDRFTNWVTESAGRQLPHVAEVKAQQRRKGHEIFDVPGEDD